jgi:hypothetical protein
MTPEDKALLLDRKFDFTTDLNQRKQGAFMCMN